MTRKLKVVCEQFPEPPILTVNYAKNLNWHEEVLKYTNGVGVDNVLENGGPGTLFEEHEMHSPRGDRQPNWVSRPEEVRRRPGDPANINRQESYPQVRLLRGHTFVLSRLLIAR